MKAKHKIMAALAGIALFALTMFVPRDAAHAQDTIRVRGTIASVDGSTYVIEARDGAELRVALVKSLSMQCATPSLGHDELLFAQPQRCCSRRVPRKWGQLARQIRRGVGPRQYRQENKAKCDGGRISRTSDRLTL